MAKITRTLLCLLIISSLLVSFASSRSAFVGENYLSARAIAIGGLASGGGDMSSAYWNPASLPSYEGNWGLFYGWNNKYNLDNWHEDQAGVVFPSIGKFRFGLFYFNESVKLMEENLGELATNPWKTSLLSLGGGWRISKNLSLGFNLKQRATKATAAGDVLGMNGITADLGLLLTIGKLHFGTVVHNHTISGEFKTASDVHFGLAWKTPEMRYQIELISYEPAESSERKLSLGGGIEAQLHPNLVLRVGRNQMPMSESAAVNVGLGLRLGYWLVDYAYAHHEIGATHYISTQMQF